MHTINSNTATTLIVLFRNYEGALQAPANVQYKIDCAENTSANNNPLLLDWTAVSTVGIKTTILIPAALNVTQNQNLADETRTVTVKAIYNQVTGDYLTSEYTYTVRKLKFDFS